MSVNYHVPVLLTEIIDALAVQPGKRYIDCTFGGGGHSRNIIQKGGLVLGLDQDQDALDYYHQHPLENITLVKTNFSHIGGVAQTHNFTNVDGILFDLGISSHQVDLGSRGFSFNKDSYLDMRMDKDLTVTAADLIAALGKKELTHLFIRYGDEPKASQIADEIISTRAVAPITNTLQLAKLIEKVYRSGKAGRIHPATKVFQALRIAVNDELHSLEQALTQSLHLLKPSGVLAVVSFHEGEDRIVKNFIKQHKEKLDSVTDKPITPGQIEINNNPRARSAKLRLAKKYDPAQQKNNFQSQHSVDSYADVG